MHFNIRDGYILYENFIVIVKIVLFKNFSEILFSNKSM